MLVQIKEPQVILLAADAPYVDFNLEYQEVAIEHFDRISINKQEYIKPIKIQKINEYRIRCYFNSEVSLEVFRNKGNEFFLKTMEN